ncbi:MAG: helix-turn-helix domain-containing protein [Clostridia bacterium]|nr:helix-turn-helix domain-containing protein [Clostridia bacterium]
MVTLEEIRNRLQEAIKASGIKQSQLARELQIHHSMIGQYLSGRSMPALDTFANLCIVLDVDPAYILGVTDFGGGRVVAKNYVHTLNNSGKVDIK